MVSVNYPPSYSGASIQAHSVNKIVIKNKIGINVLANRKSNDPTIIDGINTKRLPPKSKNPTLRGLRLIIWSVNVIICLILHRNNYDIIHILDSYYPAEILTLVGRILRKKVVVKNSIGRGAISKNKIHRNFRLMVLKRLATMIAISRETYEELRKYDFRNIVTIPNGVDTDIFKPSTQENKSLLRSDLDIDQSSVVVLYVGLLNKRKGIDHLLHAWVDIVTECPSAELLLVGPSKDKSFLLAIHKFIFDNKLSDRVKILGTRPNIQEYMQAADIFVFPSEREGLPNALMEAMSSSLPCIARTIGGVVDLIDNEDNGILCNGADKMLVDNLQKAIIKLIRDRAMRNRLGQAARQRIIQDFSIQKSAGSYIKLYTDLVDNSV
jgi:glycosyltransferase involved in cell wall biosynthesis